MPIIQYPGYLTKEEAAAKMNVKMRTIRDRLKRKTIAHIIVDGLVFIKDSFTGARPPESISIGALQWVEKFAPRHKISAERVYVHIITGKISGVIICDRVFVISNEPELLSFLENCKKE